MKMEKFILTTGEEIEIPTEINGREFDWLGRSTVSENEMRDANETEEIEHGDRGIAYVRICQTETANETARMLERLYDAQSKIGGNDDNDNDDRAGQIWESFCSAQNLADFDRRIKKITQ